MPWTTSDKVMELRGRHAAIDVIVDTLDGWRRHLSGRNASVLAFFGFLSIFPLLLAATTILGFVLEGNEDLQERIIDGALADIPVLGQQLQNDPASLTGNWWALIIGLGGALWSSTKAFVGLAGSARRHLGGRTSTIATRCPSSAARPCSVCCSSAPLRSAPSRSPRSSTPPGFRTSDASRCCCATVAINIAVLAAMYRYLTAPRPTWRDVWPGAVVAGIAFSVLQYFGTAIVDRIQETRVTYGKFALVLGLVTWLSLLAISSLMGAEFNAALVRHREGSLDRVQPADADRTRTEPPPPTA